MRALYNVRIPNDRLISGIKVYWQLLGRLRETIKRYVDKSQSQF